MAKTADQIVAAWKQGMAAAGPAYKAGTANPRANPMAAASTPDAIGRYAAGTARAAQSGYLAARLQATPLSKYVQGCATKGAANLSTGATNGTPAYAAAMQRMAPVYQAASQAAAAVSGPKGDLGTAVAKVSAALQVLIAAGKRHQGG
jgi:hypothetical protein